jgi:hypothetical protein
MSRRFGRNQRRTMRARIADLETACRMEAGLRSHMRRERDKLSVVLAQVERGLGKYFVGLPPKTVQMGPVREVPPVWNVPPAPSSRSIDARCAAVRAWLLHVDTGLDPIRESVHVVVAYEGAHLPRAAYYISPTALTSLSARDMAERLAPMLAAALLEQFRAHAA